MLAAKEGSIPSELGAAALKELEDEYMRDLEGGMLPSTNRSAPCTMGARGEQLGSPEMRAACKEEDAAYILQNLLRR